MKYIATAATNTMRPISMERILSSTQEWPDPAPDLTIEDAQHAVKASLPAMCGKRL